MANEPKKDSLSKDNISPVPKDKIAQSSQPRRIQTAEGWKRSQIKKRQQSKNASKS